MPDPASMQAATSGYINFSYGSGNQPSLNTLAPVAPTVMSRLEPSGPSRQTADDSLLGNMTFSEPLDVNIEMRSPSDLAQISATVTSHVSPDNNYDSG